MNRQGYGSIIVSPADDSEDHDRQVFGIGIHSSCDWGFVFLGVVESEVFDLNGNGSSDHYCDTGFCH